MAGHSQFKNIMHRKGAQDAKRAKIFTKHIREIETSVRAGSPEPEKNPRLRAAIQAAKGDNMPKDNIERAIKKASGAGDGANYEEVRYEGYGPQGVAIIVEGLTDNKNRTAAEVRAAFAKHGGSLGETNSVAFTFNQVGELIFPAEGIDSDAMFEAALEAGAENVETAGDDYSVTCVAEDFSEVRDALEARFGVPKWAGLSWKPNNTIQVDEDTARTLMKLIDTLEDNDDVQRVSSNLEITEDVMAALSA
ncbi:YebC/PmpR family DNA-binding transcriptional regulator [Fodinicurvata sp. EGI_FJ10296]|uniref:YebC/PmpR family DNA-binding transcriptional regulator n=1 Tax=Fodinicurvata sp. EGI_FJ10296 TaxID=3231908 RepID=UPI0034550B45